jgi:3-oxo-5-alpha-steroid 4-dehydrogenase 1
MTIPFYHIFLHDERHIHSILTNCMLYLSIPVFLFLHYVMPAPFGKQYNCRTKGAKPAICAKIAWFFFECPNILWSIISIYRHRGQVLLLNNNNNNMKGLPMVNLLLLSLFFLHYLNRSILYPLRMSIHSRPVPLSVFFSALIYTTWNG